jgi:hypothetical protein
VGKVDRGHPPLTYEFLALVALVERRPGRYRRGRHFWQLGNDELEDPLGTPRSLQLVFAEVPELRPELREARGVAHKLGGGGRDQYLPAPCSREQARNPLHRRTEVVSVALLSHPRVESHLYLFSSVPVPFSGEVPLCRHGRLQSLPDAGEGRTEGLVEGPVYGATVVLDGPAQDPVAPGQGATYLR